MNPVITGYAKGKRDAATSPNGLVGLGNVSMNDAKLAIPRAAVEP